MALHIAISSGKGGTGKTFISTNIARVLEKRGEVVRYLDCDVEEPNGHLFLKHDTENREDVTIFSPMEVDMGKCSLCGKCVEACRYNALALIKENVLFFRNLCHVCGACTIVCPENAIIEKDRKIGELIHGKSGNIDLYYALLETGEGGMSVRLIKKVKEHAGEHITILDSSPGTSCPVVETVKDADLCVLATDPTPFGINDLKLAVDMCRKLGKEPVVVCNRADYKDNALMEYCGKEGLSIIGEIPDERKVAACYSVGDLAVDRYPEYFELFDGIASEIIERAKEKRRTVIKPVRQNPYDAGSNIIEYQPSRQPTGAANGKEIVVISGKGGTGKTSLVAAFCALEKRIAVSDCDVDAADLHLLLSPEILERGMFSGGESAVIDPDLCTGCGACMTACRFDAIQTESKDSSIVYRVDGVSCEGCGTCGLVCRFNAVSFYKAINGEWYLSKTRFGPMSHAKLGIAEENSGKLVSLIRNKKNDMAASFDLKRSIIDGSPGTGCPVIASITGTDYAVVVTEPTVSGIHDLKRVLDVIRFFDIRSGIIVNKHDLNPDKTEEIKRIAGDSSSDFLGEIPYDRAFTEAQMRGVSVIEYGKSNLTDRITAVWEAVREKVFSGNGRPVNG
ncbi:MAG: 4Fe-4S binding protein [Spirochaetales bacterium]|nr:4Fe-4S binding protein [Spirochaetales bacterium]